MKLARLLALPLAAATLAIFAGCEVDSATDVQRNVGVDFTGFYTRAGTSNALLAVVGRNTGHSITSLDLRQGGDRLEAIDNNGIVFKGSIGTFDGTTASFDLSGKTTAGNAATISGTLTAAGGSTGTVGATTGTMQGTWIEDSLFSTVFAQASIPGISTGGGGGGGGSGLSISPNSTTVAIGGQQTFTASGGNGTVSWALSSNVGSLSTSTGNSTIFTRTAAGSVTLTASDSSGDTTSAAIN
jgi:hypothetical protein